MQQRSATKLRKARIATRTPTKRIICCIRHHAHRIALRKIGAASANKRTLTAYLVPEPLLARAKGAEVLGRLGDDVCPEFELDAAGLLPADFHVEEDCHRSSFHEFV